MAENIKRRICPTCEGELERNAATGEYKCPFCNNRYEFKDATGTTIVDEIQFDLAAKDYSHAMRRCKAYLEQKGEEGSSIINWLAFRAKNKINYVTDPQTKVRKPTFYDDSFTRDRVADDVYFKNALRFAEDSDTRANYEAQGALIEAIRQEACEKMAVANRCDIFISFKATEKVTDTRGNVLEVETQDQKIGRELYDYLTKLNYQVFFSPVSIGRGNMEGEKYEPTIFAALASSQIMILIRSCAD